MKALKRSMILSGTMLSKMAGASAIVLLGVAGCNSGTETTEQAGNSAAESTQQTVDAAVNSAGQAVDKAADTAATAAGNVGNVASNAASSASNAAASAGQAIAGALNTGDVKKSILANKAMAGVGDNINVTTTGKTVTLAGTVKSQAQKNVAGQIAKREASGYTVQNNLKVAKS